MIRLDQTPNNALLMYYNNSSQSEIAFYEYLEEIIQDARQNYDGFDDICISELLKKNHNLNQGNRGLSVNAIKDLQLKIRNSRTIILLYELQLASTPGELRTAIEQLFCSGFAFKIDNSGKYEQYLNGKNTIVVALDNGTKTSDILMDNSSDKVWYKKYFAKISGSNVNYKRVYNYNQKMVEKINI